MDDRLIGELEPARRDACGKVLFGQLQRAARDAEREALRRVLYQTNWNRKKAAKILDVSYKTLLQKIKECGLTD